MIEVQAHHNPSLKLYKQLNQKIQGGGGGESTTLKKCNTNLTAKILEIINQED